MVIITGSYNNSTQHYQSWSQNVAYNIQKKKKITFTKLHVTIIGRKKS